jgi:hypothetical protein
MTISVAGLFAFLMLTGLTNEVAEFVLGIRRAKDFI